MPEQAFRKIRSHALRPVYISLGLPMSAFRTTPTIDGFSAALNKPRSDLLWLFKGSDYYTFNLRTKRMERGPVAIASGWTAAASGARLPEDFKNGIDAAAWAGEAFPRQFYLFRDLGFVRLRNTTLLAPQIPPGLVPLPRPDDGRFESRLIVDDGPREVAGEWACDDSVCHLVKPSAAVHGVRDFKGMVHFFEGSNYVRHNLMDGRVVAGPGPIGEHWGLSAPFANHVDLAFYGAGPEEDHLFLVSDLECARFDTRSGSLLKIESIDRCFPEMSIHFRRPQLFLVERYDLDTYVGSVQKGEVATTVQTEARSRSVKVIVTEVVSSATTAVKQNMLQSDDNRTTADFYSRMDKRDDSASATDSYRYRMQALFQGEASAKSLWGGEVEAQLNVSGGTDSQRSSFATSTFAAIGSQVRDSTQRVSVQSMSEESLKTFTAKEFTSELKEFNNLGSDKTLDTVFFFQVEPYLSLLILRNVDAAFTDGMTEPEIFPLQELPRRLQQLSSDGSPEQANQVVEYIRRELTNIEDASGRTVALLHPGEDLRVNTQVLSRFTIDSSPSQTIDTKGIIKFERESPQAANGFAIEDRHLG